MTTQLSSSISISGTSCVGWRAMKASSRSAAHGRPCRLVGKAVTCASDKKQHQQMTAPDMGMSRRSLVLTPGLAAASGLVASLLPASLAILPAAASPAEAKSVIITGSNSGIGFDAAQKLVAGGHQVFLACRTMEKAEGAVARISEALDGVAGAGKAIPMECDLASLASVGKFADAFKATGAPLDVLCLNAGLQFSGSNGPVRRTSDGFEETVGVNHLGHFYLTNLLLPELEAAGADGPCYARVVVTASEVHDPMSPGGSVGAGATLGDLSGLEANGAAFEMIDGKAYDPDKAYKDSKLCNVLFARELQRRLEAKGARVEVNSFGPGLITRTGFFRNQPPLFTKIFDIATNEIFRVAETVDGGGNCLVYMVTSPTLEGTGGVYYNNGIPGPGQHKFEPLDPSPEAQNTEEGEKLWKISEQLVGLAA